MFDEMGTNAVVPTESFISEILVYIFMKLSFYLQHFSYDRLWNMAIPVTYLWYPFSLLVHFLSRLLLSFVDRRFQALPSQ